MSSGIMDMGDLVLHYVNSNPGHFGLRMLFSSDYTSNEITFGKDECAFVKDIDDLFKLIKENLPQWECDDSSSDATLEYINTKEYIIKLTIKCSGGKVDIAVAISIFGANPKDSDFFEKGLKEIAESLGILDIYGSLNPST